ncbi:MAG: hypothetical protein AB1649_17525 [Chloroflexota bacterium]
MTTSSNPTQKPGLVTALAVMTLISGIVNVFWTFIAFTSFFGIICAPVTVIPAILGIFELIYAAKLLGTQPDPTKPNQTLAALEIAAVIYGNVFAMVVGILALVFYNDLVVKNYFAQLNGTVPPPPAPVPAKPVLPESGPAPAIEPEVPQAEESPEKPRRTRKVAGK